MNVKTKSIISFAVENLREMKMMSFIIILGVTLITSCGLGDSKDADVLAEPTAEMISKPTTIEYEEKVYDFGELVEGESVTHIYKFTNTGENPLFIVDAKSSCGCTVPKRPEDPIMPGDQGELEVVFSSKFKPKGPIKKVIRVSANTEPSTVTELTLKGEIIAPDVD